VQLTLDSTLALQVPSGRTRSDSPVQQLHGLFAEVPMEVVVLLWKQAQFVGLRGILAVMLSKKKRFLQSQF